MLEPAIWFKILIMDVLTIDCKKQVVQWSSTRCSESSRDSDGVDSISNVVRLNEDCIDFINGLDEVFDAIPGLLSSYRSGKLTKECFYKLLIQLLHVNVLPNVKLGFENLDSVKKAIDEYNSILGSLDEVIASKTNMLSELKKTKHRERQKFTRLLVESKKLPHFDDLLIQFLECDFNADLKKIKDSEINESIPKLCRSESRVVDPGEAIDVGIALAKLSKIKNRSRLSWLYGSTPKGEEHRLQKFYIKMVETESKIKSSITKLLDNKMLLRSVVETMKSVVDELEEGLDSYGVELNTKNLIDTTSIVGESLSTKSWVSLPMHMFNIFSDANHGIAREHVEGTRKVRAIIKTTLDEHDLHRLYNSVLPETKNFSLSCLRPKWMPASPTNDVGDVAIDFRKSKSCSNIPINILASDRVTYRKDPIARVYLKRLSDSSQESGVLPSDFVFVLNSSSDFISKSIDKLKSTITDHFNLMCKKIHDEIKGSYVNVSYKKIWVIYENYFYEHTIEGLLTIYRLEYFRRIRVLTRSIDSFTLEDLDLSDSLMTKLLLGPFVESLTDSNQSATTTLSKLSFSQSITASQESLPHSSSDEDLYEDFASGEFSKSSPLNLKNTHISDTKLLRGKDCDSSPIDSLLSSATESSSIQLKHCVLSRFSRSYQNLYDALKATTPKTKAHHLLRCLRNMTWQIEAIYNEIWKKRIQLCSDDVMDGLIILLCNLHDQKALEDLYIQVQFLIQVLAQFFCNGEYHFALVQFVGVFQYLQDKAFMKKNKITSNNRS